ncbi:MAG: hypothetical protein ACI8QT_001975 [Halioglobus sp.]|jgi:hypothetical protein
MEGVWGEYEMLLEQESAPKVIAIQFPSGVATEFLEQLKDFQLPWSMK